MSNLRLPKLLRRRPSAPAPGQPPVTPSVPARTVRQSRSVQSTASAGRLDELRAQARFARERYDLYKAKTYGPRLTSPVRLGELDREAARAEASLTFAKAEAAREAEAARDRD